MNTKSEASSAASATTAARKPWISLFFATAGGAGYLPAVPGTWGSMVGVLLYWIVCRFSSPQLGVYRWGATIYAMPVQRWTILVAFIIAILGVVFSTRVARFTGKKDPQIVVIDEVSGQFLTYLLALAPLNWKYLLLGFILFRGFDVWKPFPARQAESLPGGWGIMADDWIAGIYAAMGIWIARGLGL
ncbi:MAG TPA: phosphatidylglycerophosphatase A [Candidatus Acidoferrales bacterium]|nr:phosphatidylglycerophosphatase A [Candidatus Acidoferrales bacterium]